MNRCLAISGKRAPLTYFLSSVGHVLAWNDLSGMYGRFPSINRGAQYYTISCNFDLPRAAEALIRSLVRHRVCSWAPMGHADAAIAADASGKLIG